MSISMDVNVMFLIVIAVAATEATLRSAEAAEYVVGDDLGWTIPPDGAATYAFAAGEQDLAFVTKEDLGTCNTADPLHVFENATTIKFLGTDTYYVTSTFAGHCSKGQKMTFDIAPSSTTSTISLASPSADKKPLQQSLNFVSQISGLVF
ncbi:umecyanin-like [Pyrus ussuriensis x Pyrus communis]|uniref:Umecyanin-like n=1 Tax=Pyrus ussuriensis x Pyrus communis TaxID=2448454 RepID=A0A5N5FW92_9ROSA|nr:umecyanin-like [Pyrus ussuriensis x Pyrus communis]